MQANGPGASFGLGRLVAQGEADRHENLVTSLNLYSCTYSCTVANQRGGNEALRIEKGRLRLPPYTEHLAALEG